MRKQLIYVMAAGWGAVLPLIAAAQPTLQETTAFTQALLRDYPYLLADAERAAVDAINREAREAESAWRQARGDEAKQRDIEAQIPALASRLAQALADHVSVTPVAASAAGVWQAEQGTTFERHAASEKMITLNLAQMAAASRIPGYLELPGDVGALLLRVNPGGQPLGLMVSAYDFAGGSHQHTITLPHAGETWIVLGLVNVPQLRTSPLINLDAPGLGRKSLAVYFTTPDWGRFKAAILSDDTGKPAPAMVRLVWKTDGRDRKPRNAIDFAPQFDTQGSATGRRNINTPGALGGQHFWCVPGPIDMSLPPGAYDITIRRGLEHRPVFDSFTVAAHETVKRTYRPTRWVDMRKHGWYSGDDHVHTQILSEDDAARVMAWAQAEDVHLCNIVKMGDINRTWFEQRGFGPDHRVISGDYILSPGQECPRTHSELGHTLSMNIREMVRDTDKYYLYDWVFDNVHAQGGLSGYAHVNSGIFYVHRDMSMNIPKGKVDFAEIMQFGNLGTDLYYEFLNLGFPLTASTGSDVPWGGTIGEARVYAYTGKKGKFTADKWFEAMRAGHTFVTNGPMLEFGFNKGKFRPGDSIEFDGEVPSLEFIARAWCDPALSPVTRLELIQNGEVMDSIESGGASELTLNSTARASKGYWIAAHAVCADGTQAHTTPIYLHAKGYRHWKFDAIEDLLEKRLASLQEIENLVKTTVERFKSGEMDYTRRDQVQLALQGEELLKRVEAARDIYSTLRKAYAAEKPGPNGEK